MIILLLTIFVSITLAAFFAALFVLQRRDEFASNAEHDALLPLQDGQRQVPPCPPAEHRAQALPSSRP